MIVLHHHHQPKTYIKQETVIKITLKGTHIRYGNCQDFCDLAPYTIFLNIRRIINNLISF